MEGRRESEKLRYRENNMITMDIVGREKLECRGPL